MLRIIKNEFGNWVCISEEEYNEALKYKRVVRKGVVIKKKVSDKKGYRYDPNKKREVRISPEEMRKRKRAARKSAIKRRAKKSQISIQRKKSDKVRKSRNI